LRVTYKEFPDPSNGNQSTVSRGSAFLVDRDRGYFLTAKHVLLGSKVWSTFFPNNPFADLEAAIEDYLYSEKVQITLQADEDAPPIPASLIALDRNSDLALIAVYNLNNITLSQFPALYRPMAMASDIECTNLQVTAVGFTLSPNSTKMRRDNSPFGRATCDFYPKTYYIGGQKYRIPLFNTTAAFKPGFSGGPVLDSDLQVIGVVSGATAPTESQNWFFVPLSAVRSFLSRFR